MSINTKDIIITSDTSKSMQEVSIEQIINLIRQGYTTEILFQENEKNIPNIIKIISGNYFCIDIREVKPVITTHGPCEIYIRSHDKDQDGIITSWKEYYVKSASIYSQLKVNR